MSPFVSDGTTETVSVGEGNAAVISAPQVASYPPASMKWYNSAGNPLPVETMQYHVTLSNQLVVLSSRIDRDDGNQFQVIGKNIYTATSAQGPRFRLRVMSKKFILIFNPSEPF